MLEHLFGANRQMCLHPRLLPLRDFFLSSAESLDSPMPLHSLRLFAEEFEETGAKKKERSSAMLLI